MTEIKTGAWVDTPRFCKVQIEAVYENEEAAYAAGYTEPTYYRNPDFGILGKSLNRDCMDFAAFKKD